MPLTARARLLFTCLAIGCAPTAAAAAVDWLYDIEVQVASQADVERRRAASAGLAEVLSRVTGMVELPHHPEVADALRQPERFYARYEYSRRLPEAAGDASPTPATFLTLRFEPASILAMLRAADLPIWAANRPTILAWVAVQRGEQRRVSSATAPGELAAALQRRARQRGLKLLLPLLDLRDSALATASIWGLFWDDIQAASDRYAPDLLLVGRAVEGIDGRWSADWQLRAPQHVKPLALHRSDALAVRRQERFDSFAESFQQQAASAGAAALLALDGAANALADRFSVRGTLGSIAVAVRGAQTVRGYASLLSYLQSQEFIERVDVDVVRPQTIGLRLHSRSNRAQLRKLLSVGDMLVAEATADGPLSLSWRGAR